MGGSLLSGSAIGTCLNGSGMQEIGFTHMRILEGVGTLIQLGGLMARLCKIVSSISRLISGVPNLPKSWLEHQARAFPAITLELICGKVVSLILTMVAPSLDVSCILSFHWMTLIP